MNLPRKIIQILCRHEWTEQDRDSYDTVRLDGSKEGEVTLILMQCLKCGKYKAVPTERTHCK